MGKVSCSKRVFLAPLLMWSILGSGFAAPAAAADNPEKKDAAGESPAKIEEVVVTGHFVATGASAALKQDVSVMDTPFSVSAYTGDFMKSIQTTQVADLYRYMTGLQKAGATGYDLTLRGFATSDFDRNAIMTDGLPGLAVRFGSPPTVGTDHMEIVKGAASLFYGMVQPGGFVNIVSKKPSAHASTELAVRATEGASSRDRRLQGGDFSFDSTGPIDEAGTVLYRLIGQKSSDDRFRDNSFERGEYLAPMVTWNISDNTSVTAQAEYRSVHSNYANVFLLAPRLPTGGSPSLLAADTTNYMSPTDYLNERGITESLFINHLFDNGMKWTFSFRNVDHYDTAHAWDMIGFDKKDPTLQTIDIRARGQHNHRTYVFGDTNLAIPFDTWGIGHKVLVGLNQGREVDDFSRTQYCKINSPSSPNADPTCNLGTAQYTINQQHPNFSNIPPLTAFGLGVINQNTRARNYVTGDASGAYLSDLATFGEHWKGTLGVRYARERQENFADLNEPALGGVIQVSTAVLPQVGLIYEPSKEWSFYASYSTSFTPVPPGTLGLYNSYNFQPTRGKGYEVGAKSELDGGKVNITAALFKIEQTNLIQSYGGTNLAACPSGSCSEQVGAAQSDGLELELSAVPLPGWTVLAGFARTNARITQSDVGGPLVGGLLPNSPKNAGHVWVRYDFSTGELNGLGIGAGYSYTGERIAFTPNTALPHSFTLPSYQVMDLAVYYALNDKYNFSLKATNLFDEKYYSSAGVTAGMINAQPGIPRTITATASYKF